MKNNTPTKQQYEEAMKTVNKYEKRQADLDKLNKDLGECLKNFADFKFDVDDENEVITFTGTQDCENDVMPNTIFKYRFAQPHVELKLTKAKTHPKDKFEPMIGKLICVKKALGESYKYIERYVEEENTFSSFHFYVGESWNEAQAISVDYHN